MNDSLAFRKAAAAAEKYLALVSPTETARFAVGGEEGVNSVPNIINALDRSKANLDNACTQAFESRVRSLEQIYRKQRYINLLHLLTGSGFAVLLTNHFEEPMKWIGAVVSFGAAAAALWLPRM